MMRLKSRLGKAYVAGLATVAAMFVAGISLSADARAFSLPQGTKMDGSTSRSLLPYEVKEKTLGVVSCASSLCHGSVTEWKGSNVMNNEYVTWLRLDKHAGAARLLLNAQSQKIAANLGLKEPAEKSKICLDCHAHNPNPESTGRRAIVADGVGCEGCHGPSEKWIASHTVPGTTHAQNVANGMYPTDRPIDRARLCISCHFGNVDRFVTHRIMGAGHPRLSFELETFSHLAPSHVRIDADYATRKGAWNGAKVWAIGQALATAETMKVLKSPERGRDGVFPELVLFDCYACHHKMSDKRWTSKSAFGSSPGPGTPRLNDASLLMLRAILRGVDPGAADRLNDLVPRLHRAIAGDGNPMNVASDIQTLAETAAEKISQNPLGEKELRGVALALVDDGIAGSYKDYSGAEQSVMAIGSVLNYLSTEGLIRDTGAVNRGLVSLREPLANDEEYKSADFLARLREFRTVVASLPSTAGEKR